MSTPCVEYPTLTDVQNIRNSINERREERERFYQEREPTPIRLEGNKVYAGEFTYEVVSNPEEIQEIVSDQREDTKIKRRVRRERESNMTSEEIKQRQVVEGKYWSPFQRDIGEMESARVAEHVLGLNLKDFDRGKHGFDHVFEDPDGRPVVMIEAKFTNDADGTGSLDWDKGVGQQASLEWTIHRARQMQDPASGYYSEKNAKLAEEILANPQGVKRLVKHIHPTTLNMTISEGKPEGGWKQIAVLKPDIGLEGE